jgi:hypothetical protein
LRKRVVLFSVVAVSFANLRISQVETRASSSKPKNFMSCGGCSAGEDADHEIDLVQIVMQSLEVKKRKGSMVIHIQNLDGNGVDLLVMPQATVLQVKNAISRAEGTPAFQQSLWAEGAESELENKISVSESGLTNRSTIFLIKADAASWQLVMLSNAELFEALGDFMALSTWREEGGYEQAGKTMEAQLEEWHRQAQASELSQRELLRRKVVVGRFFVVSGLGRDSYPLTHSLLYVSLLFSFSCRTVAVNSSAQSRCLHRQSWKLSNSRWRSRRSRRSRRSCGGRRGRKSRRGRRSRRSRRGVERCFLCPSKQYSICR